MVIAKVVCSTTRDSRGYDIGILLVKVCTNVSVVILKDKRHHDSSLMAQRLQQKRIARYFAHVELIVSVLVPPIRESSQA